MTLYKTLGLFILTVMVANCTQTNSSQNPGRIRNLSEKTGIEMIVIDEAEKITGVHATRYLRRMRLNSYIDDPIQSAIRQEAPKDMTVELSGISFLVHSNQIEGIVERLNKKLSYRQCLSFISNDDTRDDKLQTISIVNTTDKFDLLRLQETSGSSFHYSTDSLIKKLQVLDDKYPIHLIGVGEDWLLLQAINPPTDGLDFAKEILKVCPVDEGVDTIEYVNTLKKSRGRVSMWWD